MGGRRVGGCLVALAVAAVASGLELILLHTNDMHARVEEVSQTAGACFDPPRCYGGMARVKALVDKVRSENRNVLFLNAGDNFQGTPYYTVHKWKVIARFIDMLGIDAMSLGNHEFDDGVNGLVPYLKNISTPSVAANVDTHLEPSFIGANLQPWINLTIDNTMIAVVGYLTPDTKFLARTGQVIINDEIESVRNSAKEARRKGAKIVFAVGHSGYDVDKAIAKQVEEVDVVIGGHTNTFLYTGNPPDIEVPADVYPHFETQDSGKKVPVVQAFAYTKYLGYLELTFDESFKLVSAKGNPILLKSSFPKDKELEAEIGKWRDEVKKRGNKVIGTTVVDLDAECRMKECNIGNFITDSWIDYAITANVPPSGWVSASIAITNGGSIRTPIIKNQTNEGQVTVGMFLTTLPFQNELLILNMTGSILLETLEKSVWDYDPSGVIQKGGFLQVSGLKVVFDVGAVQGKRVLSAMARCADCMIPTYSPVEADKTYNVITNSFLAEGGDGIHPLRRASRINLGESDNQAAMTYFSKLEKIYPGNEGRVVVLNKANEPERSMATSGINGLLASPLISAIVSSSVVKKYNGL